MRRLDSQYQKRHGDRSNAGSEWLQETGIPTGNPRPPDSTIRAPVSLLLELVPVETLNSPSIDALSVI